MPIPLDFNRKDNPPKHPHPGNHNPSDGTKDL